MSVSSPSQIVLFILFLPQILLAAFVLPEGKPLYEVGLFAGAAAALDYPASDQKHFRWLAVPTITYRGNILKSNREEGTKALFFNSENFEISLSGGGSFPVESKNNSARKGMPNLDWVLELGPKINLYFINRPGDKIFYFYLPFRQLFTTDFAHFGETGYTVAPGLFYQLDHLSWDFFSFYGTITFNWYDTRANDYFFTVKKEFETPTRKEYFARSGYSSTDLSAAFAVALKDNLTIFLGISLYDFSSSANSQSPLFKSRNNWSFGTGITYTWLESEIKVYPVR